MKNHFLWEAARMRPRQALPILSFPAVQKLHVTVNELVHSASLQAQAMAYVANNTPTVAAVSLMDLSVEAEAFGAHVRFTDGEVPSVTGQLVDSPEAAQALRVPDAAQGRAPLCEEALRLAKPLLLGKPLLAGVIGPYSLAGRLMDVTEIMYACYDEPESVHTVLRKATEYIISCCQRYRAAGANGVVMAEPLAGLLSADMADAFSCPYVRQIIDAVQTDDFLVVYHNCGNTVPMMLNSLYAMNAAAYHFGNAVDIARIVREAPENKLVMGNIDPAGQFANGTPDSIRAAVRTLLDACGTYNHFLLSSGCDIPAHAKWENIQAFFDEAVR